MEMVRTLVLGASGRLGGMLRAFWGVRPAVLWQSRHAGMPGALRFDPLDRAALQQAARGADTILCLAGVTPARAAQGADLAKNSELARAALRAGAETGARVLLASSAAVYGRGGDDGGHGNGAAPALDEDAPLAPQNAYGRAKAGMEGRARDLAARLGVPLCLLRIGNVAGADAILGGWRPGFLLDRLADGTTPRRSYIGPATFAGVMAGLCGLDAERRGRPDLPQVLNIAAPGAPEMGALLAAAGLPFALRPAPAGVIPRVELATGRLERLVPLAPDAGHPATLVREWRDWRRAAA